MAIEPTQNFRTMNKLKIILSLTVATLLWSCNRQSVDDGQTINPLLGDISFTSKFGHQPDSKTNEDLRIKTHLEYVENLLRQQDISGLSPELQQKRNHLLDLLHNYWTAGIFPRNYDYKDQRQPCFLDKDGRICAVGYLVEQTTSRQVAEEINSNHKYDKLLAMNDNSVDNWIKSSGLSKQECAMIQPTYGPPPVYSNNYISPAYGLTSSILTGINLSFNTINGIQISKGAKDNTVPILGLLTGAGQIALGIGNFPKDEWLGFGIYETTNESQKVLSMVNIGLGTTTMVLSTWNLIANKKPKTKLTSWNLYGIPTRDNSVGLAFYFSRTF